MAIGDLVANLTANTTGFSRGLNSARGMLGGFVGNVTSSLAQIGLAFQGLGAIRSVASGAGSFVKLAADLEQTKIAFEVMTGSAEQANTMLAQMRQFASTTPLDTAGIQTAGRTLLQFGIEADQVLPILRMLGDVSGGDKEKLKSLALVFGQMSAAGRLMGQDLLQFINTGFNPLQEISKHTGESMVSLKKRMEDGAISSAMVAESFKRATSQGGQFFGMLQRQGQTTTGLFGQLQDAVSLSMTDIGQAIIEGFDLKGVMGDLNSFSDVFRSEWLPGITTGINQIGQAFQRVVAFMRSGWTEWLSSSLASMVDFVTKFDLYFQIAQQRIVLFASNGIIVMDDFFTNVRTQAVGMAEAFHGSLMSMLKALQAFKGGSIKELAGTILGAGAGGFAAGVGKIPETVSTALAETTPELEALYKTLADRQASAATSAITQATTAAESSLRIGRAQSAAGSKNQALSIATRGSQEASKAINAAIRSEKDKAAEQTAENTAELASTATQQLGVLQDISGSVKGGKTPVVVSFA